eukprot:TRINITY_DN121196_c0_g1_i1.p1 TRINITY_DN121196_c0_g1~~TRINITY_DN121196_c0_g1_i1.p1  ORF type:complete len:309 (+),score=-8.81 TRINITY_DN121196_c0_g1_i1:94-927(+)
MASKSNLEQLHIASSLMSFLVTLCYTLMGTSNATEETTTTFDSLAIGAITGAGASFFFKLLEELTRFRGSGCSLKTLLNFLGRGSQLVTSAVVKICGKTLISQIAVVVSAVLNCVDSLVKRESDKGCGFKCWIDSWSTIASFATTTCFTLKGLGNEHSWLMGIAIIAACVSFACKISQEFLRSCVSQKPGTKCGEDFNLVKAGLNFMGRGVQIAFGFVVDIYETGVVPHAFTFVATFFNLADAAVKRRRPKNSKRLLQFIMILFVFCTFIMQCFKYT